MDKYKLYSINKHTAKTQAQSCMVEYHHGFGFGFYVHWAQDEHEDGREYLQSNNR